MDSLVPWLNENWFPFLQSVGIGGSLLFTAVTLRRDLQAKRAREFLILAGQHRRLWGQLHRRPKLARLLDPDRDVAARPVSTEERLFLELAFVHFHTGWLLAREGSLTPMSVLAADAGHFFRLPIPAFVWERTKSVLEPEFVTFVDEAVAADASKHKTPSIEDGKAVIKPSGE
jgi:hypothetical protein